ncbi:hypothetical protein [Haloarcula litorea]|uniref:hypothetical protein n=1 Tax=Haloarcula litorea TaxID=3032579 RepID=UPI0023E88F2D|nr:hypothetical protein [Halomicroarcula sp. GDY20]
MNPPDVTDEDTLEYRSEAVKEIENWIRENCFEAENIGVVAGPQVNRETGHWWVHIQVQHRDTGRTLNLDMTYARRQLSTEEVAQEYSRLRNDIRHRFREAELRFSNFNEYYESVIKSTEKIELG